MPTERPALSAFLITRDAAAQLPDCLASLAFCEEILVVDSGSADGSADLARRLGARVIESDWRGFGPQKQFAVEQAAHDWVLCIDADERVSDCLAASIERAHAAAVPTRAICSFRRFGVFASSTFFAWAL